MAKSNQPSKISYNEENTKHVKPTLITRSLTNFKVPFVSIIKTEKKPDSKKNRGIRQLLIYLPIILIHSSAGAIFSEISH